MDFSNGTFESLLLVDCVGHSKLFKRWSTTEFVFYGVDYLQVDLFTVFTNMYLNAFTVVCYKYYNWNEIIKNILLSEISVSCYKKWEKRNVINWVNCEGEEVINENRLVTIW